MAFRLTNIDRDLLKESVVSLQVDPGLKLLGSEPVMTIAPYGQGYIPFQFPPRITGDGKSMSWTKTGKMLYEPLAIYGGAESRKIDIAATYLVTNHTNKKGFKWNVANIEKTLRAYKQYFYVSIFEGAKYFPIFKVRIYHSVQGPSDWRSTGVSIKPGSELIKQDNKILPMFHEVSLSLELQTNIDKAGKKQVPHFNLKPKPPPEWY